MEKRHDGGGGELAQSFVPFPDEPDFQHFNVFNLEALRAPAFRDILLRCHDVGMVNEITGHG